MKGFLDVLHNCNWAKHPKYEDVLVSDTGRVLSYKTGKHVELKPNDNGLGYQRVGIGHGNPQYIHRLVAETFLPNDDPEKNQVNHKDGNKHNNNLYNLEWCTQSYNDRHAFKHGLKVAKGRPVEIVETGEIFCSEAECARAINGIQGNIAQCLAGKRHTHRGYHFKYAEGGEYND